MPILQGVAAAPSPPHHPQYASPHSPQLQHRPSLAPSPQHMQQSMPSYATHQQQQQQPHATSSREAYAAQARLPPSASQHQLGGPSSQHSQVMGVGVGPQTGAGTRSAGGGGGYGMPINSASLHGAAAGPSRNPAMSGPDSAGQSSLMPTTAASLMREGPRDFTVIKSVGDGSFGTVCLADWKSPLPSGTMLSPMQHPTTRPEYVGKRLVAIKRMKKPFKAWGDCLKLKELKSLLDIPHHPNIIPLYDAFLDPSSKELHFVFECMEGNLYQLTKSRKGRPLAGGLVASIFQQIILGLDHIHKHGYFHRDMKPENLLITTTGLDDYPSHKIGGPAERDVIVIVKLADFGLARETASKPPYTEYVSTRWYRAPEVLLRSRDYSNPVDMWALGTILAELVNLKPLFPGESEVDQVLQICEVLGNPSPEYGTDSKGRVRGGGAWERGIRMAASVGFQWPKSQPIKFSSLFSSRVPMELITCIEDLLRYDPAARATTMHCMEHTYFKNVAPRLQPLKGRGPVVSATKPPAEGQPPAAMPLAVDATAHREALPPSHSNMPAGSRPPFGEGQSANYQRVPFYRPPHQQGEEEAQRAYRSGAVPDPSAYPSFPQSAAIPPMDSQQLGMPSSQDDRMAHPAFFPERPPPGHPESQLQPFPQQQPERKKGWGMAISSVFSGGSNSNAHVSSQAQQPQDALSQAGSRNPSFALARPSMQHGPGEAATGIYPPDSRTADAAPLDPKKAKKEAEKAAKQAEKAKRMIQEKAARDRARAVMQKRNQILAASTIKEQVEWLEYSPPGTAGAPIPAQSEKARGKQAAPAPGFSPSQSPATTFGSGVSPNESNSMPQTPYSPGSGMYSPGFYAPRHHATVGGPGGPAGPGGHSGSMPAHLLEMRDSVRPISMQSYQTGDSDPGPQSNRAMPGYPNVLQRQSSASSLSSGLDIMAQQQRYSHSTPHGRYMHPPHSGGRSVESLDPQLVSNMENMTAAERNSGSASPAPGFPLGAPTGPPTGRSSISRQGGKTRSRASSIQRAGSASPLHHPIAPRFHPYGMAAHPPQSSHSQSSSHSHSHYPVTGIHLPSLQLSLDDEHRRARSHSNAAGGPRPSATGRRRSSLSQQRPTVSRGSIGSNSAFLHDGMSAAGIHSPAPNHHAPAVERWTSGGHGGVHAPSQHHVNPMWGGSDFGRGESMPGGSDTQHQLQQHPPARAPVPGAAMGNVVSDTRLPPFSSLMAAADARSHVREVDEEDSEMAPGESAAYARSAEPGAHQSGAEPRWQSSAPQSSVYRQ